MNEHIDHFCHRKPLNSTVCSNLTISYLHFKAYEIFATRLIVMHLCSYISFVIGAIQMFYDDDDDDL